ncbi:MAG: T9SS type A sorting domain-containing protein, partial [Verrucomicrobia bacterium]|nr:T9SS type A sorting domain-containing protein [Cytophagales bacterium]
ITDPILANPQEVVLVNNLLWTADAENGLLLRQNGVFQSFLPNAPFRNETFELYTYDDNVVTLGGGYNTSATPDNSSAGFYIFKDGNWQNFNKNQTLPSQKIPDVKDLVAAAYSPATQNLYLASFGDGLLLKKPDQTFEVFNQNNSPLRTDITNRVKVTGLATDAESNVWVINYGVSQTPLHVRKTDNTWQSFNVGTSLAASAVEILIDQTNYKWLRINTSEGGIIIFDEKTQRNRYLTTGSGRGNLPGQSVYSMALDKDGAVWLGTERGIAVLFNTSQAFLEDISLPFFENRPLLREEIVTAIAVDGGNRKWIGTRTGLWLFNADGSQLIERFTTNNSPLPSNIVQSIGIQPITGEVFVATDKGLVSYRGSSTISDGTNQQVKVFPNPVRFGFQGLVGISGLASNATVKITDVTGRLVYQTQANGGTAIWNVQDYKSRQAKTGIYLIFSALPDGTQGFVGKMAVIE